MAISTVSSMDATGCEGACPGRLENRMSLITCAMRPCCASMEILVLGYDRYKITALTRKNAQTYPLRSSRADSQHLSLYRISETAKKYQTRCHTSSRCGSLTLLDELPFSPGGRGGTIGFV